MKRRKTLNSNQVCSAMTVTLRHILPVAEWLGIYIPVIDLYLPIFPMIGISKKKEKKKSFLKWCNI